MEMYPSLKDGDLALGYRLEREYRTGDVIVYEAGGALHFGRVAVKEEENTDEETLSVPAGLPDRPGRQHGWRRSVPKTGKGKDYNDSQKKRPCERKKQQIETSQKE